MWSIKNMPKQGHFKSSEQRVDEFILTTIEHVILNYEQYIVYLICLTCCFRPRWCSLLQGWAPWLLSSRSSPWWSEVTTQVTLLHLRFTSVQQLYNNLHIILNDQTHHLLLMFELSLRLQLAIIFIIDLSTNYFLG